MQATRLLLLSEVVMLEGWTTDQIVEQERARIIHQYFHNEITFEEYATLLVELEEWADEERSRYGD